MSDWQAVPLSEVVSLRRGHDLPTKDRRPGNVPVISSGDTEGWHDTAIDDGPGVVLGRATNIGRPKWTNGPYWPHNTTLYVTDFKGNVPRWVFHLFETMDLGGYNSGSVQPMLNRNFIAQVPVSLPPPEEQERIASVLRAFDNLIETNRRTAAASLELAMAAFGRLDAWAGDLVPLNLVTTKIGSGATPRGGKSIYVEDGVSFIRSQNVQDGTFSFDGLAKISDEASEALRGVTVLPGDVLINITGESVTRTALVPERALPARVSQHVAIVRPEPTVLDSRFLLLALLSDPIRAHLNSLSTAGATRRALTKAHLGGTKIPLPPLDVQRRAARVLDAIHELEEEIAELTRTREELLPLLMSGRVRVDESLEVSGWMR